MVGQMPSVHYQEHSGSGDNVARDKIVNVCRDLAPADLKVAISLILDSIREKKIEKASIQLEVVRVTQKLDGDAKAILEVLAIHLNLLKDEDVQAAYKYLVEYLAIAVQGLARDLCLAGVMRLDCKSGRSNDAVKRFNKESVPEAYAQEVYYELLADKEELARDYSERELELSEGELTGLVRGALRLDSSEIASIAVARLRDCYPSFNSKVLSLFVVAVQLNSQLVNAQLWLVNSSLRSKVIAVANECAELMSISKGQDVRLFNIAVPTLQFLLYKHDGLLAVCWEYRREIEAFEAEFVAEFIADLYVIMENDHSRLKGVTGELAIAQEDSKKKQKILEGVLCKGIVTVEEVPLLLALASKLQISKWRTDGGIFSAEDSMDLASANILLALRLIDADDHLACSIFKEEVESYLKSYSARLKNLSQFYLANVCEKLHGLGLSHLSCDIIRAVLPEEDIWLSPLVEIYVRSLFECHQMGALSDVLEDIGRDNWSDLLWFIQAHILKSIGDYSGAVIAVRSAIEKVDRNPNYWEFALKLSRHSDEWPAVEILDKIQLKIFDSISVPGLRILLEFARLGRFGFVESTLLHWFVADPVTSAKDISNFYFGSLLALESKCYDSISSSLGKFITGVEYLKDGRPQIKLIVEGLEISNSYILDAKSPLGEKLLAMSAGEIKSHGMNELKLIERLPPFVALLRIATKIREQQNDGSDVFYSIVLPSAPEELLPFIEKTLRRQDGQVDSSSLDSDPKIPLLLKGFKICPSDPVKAAFRQLTSKGSSNHGLLNLGESVGSFVVDVYTVCYLCLIGVVEVVCNGCADVYISVETKKAIESWLSDVTRDNYMSIGLVPSGGLLRVTADDMSDSDLKLIESLKCFLSMAKVLSPKLGDLPSEYMIFSDAVDNTIFSTMKISKVNDIPWLSVDGYFSQIHQGLGGRIVNIFDLAMVAGGRLTFEQKRFGLSLSSVGMLPYVFTWRDFDLLAQSTDHLADSILSKILALDNSVDLTKNENSFALARIVAVVILKSISTEGTAVWSVILDADFVQYASAVAYAAIGKVISVKSIESREQLLARFYVKVIRSFRRSTYARKLTSKVFYEFAKGHFLEIESIDNFIRIEFES